MSHDFVTESTFFPGLKGSGEALVLTMVSAVWGYIGLWLSGTPYDS